MLFIWQSQVHSCKSFLACLDLQIIISTESLTSLFTLYMIHIKSQNWQDQICYIKDENLLANWEKAFAKTTLRECCEHNMHYDVAACCEGSEGGCDE